MPLPVPGSWGKELPFSSTTLPSLGHPGVPACLPSYLLPLPKFRLHIVFPNKAKKQGELPGEGRGRLGHPWLDKEEKAIPQMKLPRCRLHSQDCSILPIPYNPHTLPYTDPTPCDPGGTTLRGPCSQPTTASCCPGPGTDISGCLGLPCVLSPQN